MSNAGHARLYGLKTRVSDLEWNENGSDTLDVRADGIRPGSIRWIDASMDGGTMRRASGALHVPGAREIRRAHVPSTKAGPSLREG